MSYKSDFLDFLHTKGESVRAFTDDRRVYRYKKPAGKSKPKLFDDSVPLCGPVKVFTKEEIEEYQKQLEREKKKVPI